MTAMVVVITNLTDLPESKKTPTRLAIYTALLDPGEELKLPASMVDARLRKLETDGYIAIGQLPSWYAASKAKKSGSKRLTTEEIEKLIKKPVATAPKVEAKRVDAPPITAPASDKDKPTDKK